MTHTTHFNFGMSNNRVIARKFKYYIRENIAGAWDIEDYHHHVIASFCSREEAFAAVAQFVVEDRAKALAVQ